jgi:hypothetical protein
MNQWKVPKLWDGGECWIIGGGKSVPYQFSIPEDVIEKVCTRKLPNDAYSPYMEAIHDRHVIGVNNAYQLGEWIDFLFFGDGSWHLVHQRKLAKWQGMKVTCSPKFATVTLKDKFKIKYLAKDKKHKHGITSDCTKVSWNSNSGAAAISLAHHLGVKRVYLLGFDMNVNGNFTHWHGSHGNKAKKGPPFKKHLQGFPEIAKDAKKMGLEILNVNKQSAITNFPKVTLKEALNGKSIS